MAASIAHVASYGDATDIASFSGIPWHVIDGLRRVGVDARGLTLAIPSRLGRVAHAAGRTLLTGGHGGYQYSAAHLDRIWAPVRPQIDGSTVLNLFQLYAPQINAASGVRRWFYIDATLSQLIDTFGDLKRMAVREKARLIARERAGYVAAHGVIGHSQWVANSLVEQYGVEPARVHVVVPGANLDLDRYADWARVARPSDATGPLRLVFTGMHAHRKGLDRLLAGMARAQAKGVALALSVIGAGPETVPKNLRALAGVTWHGRIEKRTAADRFLRLVAGAEVGCLLSRAECGGVGQREYAALGLALIAPDTGGAPDHAGRHRAVLIDPAAPSDTIAAVLTELATRGALYRRLREAAWATREEALQTTTARRLLAILSAQAAA